MRLRRSLFLVVIIVLWLASPAKGQTLNEGRAVEVASAFLNAKRSEAMIGSNAFFKDNAIGNAGSNAFFKDNAKGNAGSNAFFKDNAKGNAGCSAFFKDNVKGNAGSNAFLGDNVKGNGDKKYDIVVSMPTMAVVEDAENGIFVLVAGTDSAAFVAGYGESGESLPPQLMGLLMQQLGVLNQQVASRNSQHNLLIPSHNSQNFPQKSPQNSLQTFWNAPQTLQTSPQRFQNIPNSLPNLQNRPSNAQNRPSNAQNSQPNAQNGQPNAQIELSNLQNGVANVKPARTSSVGRNVQWAIEDGFRLPVDKMVESVRSLGDPFNRRCPYYTYETGLTTEVRSLVGCVATAAEQVVSFWKWPAELEDSIAGFDTEHNGLISTIPAGTKIDFDNILPVYIEGQYSDAQAQAVADLSYYLGVACRMNWAVGASGAQLYNLVEPLKRAFGYGYVRYLCSYDYSQRQWFRLLMKELEAGRPVVYAGYISSGGGHAFVIDGIDADGYFHINWGYGGQYDGWFDLQVLTPQESPLEPTFEGTVMGLNHMQEALFLAPDSVEYQTGDTLSWQYRLAINGVRFLRAPDTNMYLTAEIDVSNLGDEQIYAPVQLFTYTQLDSVGYPADIDYLGVADGQLEAHQDSTLTAYLSLSEAGTRLLGLSTADSLYLAFDTLEITKAQQPALNYTLQDSVVLSDAATFALKIDNLSPQYWSGRMVTYSLFEGPYTVEEGDFRHFTVLNLAPQHSQSDVVSFSNLRPQTDYTFVVRSPWQPVMEVAFTTSAPTAIHSATDNPTIDTAMRRPLRARHPSYRLNNRISIEYNESTGRYQQVLSH